MSTPWTFVHINDTQPGAADSFRFQQAWLENEAQAYRQIAALQPELILVGGDLTRDGASRDNELRQAKDRLNALGIAYHAIPGNMDTGNKHAPCRGGPGRDDPALNVRSEQLQRFARHFGPCPWSFVHRNVRFTGLYEAVAGSGLPEEDRMWAFLEELAGGTRAEHHVLVNHYPLFIDRMDEPNFDLTRREQYIPWYFCIDHPHRDRLLKLYQQAGVSVVLSGHIHCRRPMQSVAGIRFYKTAATSFGQWDNRWPDGDTTLGFFQFTVDGPNLHERFIPLSPLSTSTLGWGPGGHPGAEQIQAGWEERRRLVDQGLVPPLAG